MPPLYLGLGVLLWSGSFTTPPCLLSAPVFAQSVVQPWVKNSTNPVQLIARQTTVRILTSHTSGSGVLVRRQGQVYTLLTSWHVVAFSKPATILTPDGRKYSLLPQSIQQLGNADLAIAQFHSPRSYRVAAISTVLPTAGDRVYAAGFPMYQGTNLTTTFDQGIHNFQITQGTVSLFLSKPLEQGYRLGYSNEVLVGMSGGPILNDKGQLVGINGRVKGRDPDFGVYVFEDGTEPDSTLLEQMIDASWGIPVTPYLQFLSS